jgi:hypothetical protein
MKRKTYFALLFCAVAGLATFGADLPKVHSGDRAANVPETWRGTWEVTVAYHNHETGALVSTDVTTAAICPGEPILPALFGVRLQCSDEADDGEIGVVCRAKLSPKYGCNVFVQAGLESQRNGDNWNGTGSWTAKVVGECEHSNFGEDIVVTGRRISGVAMCDGARLSLAQRFFMHSALVPVLGGGN